MKNEILEEVWHHRDEFARQHGYDLDAMVATLNEMQRHSLNLVVDRRKEPPNTRVQPSALRNHPTVRAGEE